MICYALFMVCCDSIAKTLSSTQEVVNIVWYRYFFHTVSLVIIACFHFYKFREIEYVESHPFQLLRGATLVISTLFFFHSIALMPLAQALALLYIFPVVSVFLSVIFLKESFTATQGLVIATAFVGVLLILQPSNDIPVRPGLLALMGGVFMGIYMFFTKASSRKSSPNMSSLYTGLVGIIFIPFFPGFEMVRLEGQALLMAGMMGLFAAMGHYAMFLSMRFAPSSLVSPYAFSEILFAGAIGYFLFGDTLNLISGIAILLLITSGIVFARISNATKPPPVPVPPGS